MTKKNGAFLINYLNSGGEDGVVDILADIVRERVREWAIAVNEGPQRFKDAIGAQEEAVEILVKTIAGEELEAIDSSVPTPILFKYFNKPMIMPNKDQVKKWGKKWKVVEEMLEQEDRIRTEKAIQKRRNIIKMIKTGNGTQPIPQLGITLNRLNIGDITIKQGTQLEKAAEREVTEERERAAEILELKHVRNRIKELTEMKYSLQEARDIVQTERSKVDKKINEIIGIDLEGLGRGLGQDFKK